MTCPWLLIASLTFGKWFLLFLDLFGKCYMYECKNTSQYFLYLCFLLFLVNIKAVTVLVKSHYARLWSI